VKGLLFVWCIIYRLTGSFKRRQCAYYKWECLTFNLILCMCLFLQVHVCNGCMHVCNECVHICMYTSSSSTSCILYIFILAWLRRFIKKRLLRYLFSVASFTSSPESFIALWTHSSLVLLFHACMFVWPSDRTSLPLGHTATRPYCRSSMA